jgi:hypothetical protein
MNIQKITLAYLKANGFDGLVDAGLCACKCDDLMPCDNPSITDCNPGYLMPQSVANEQGFEFMLTTEKGGA